MEQKTYIVEGRQFRTEADYARAVRDKELIEKLRRDTGNMTREELEHLKEDVHNGKYRFMTMLGPDFEDELDEKIQKATDSKAKSIRETKRGGSAKTKQVLKSGQRKNNAGVSNSQKSKQNVEKNDGGMDAEMEAIIQAELRRQEKRRSLLIAFCGILALFCLGYVGIYSYYGQRTNNSYSELSELKEKPLSESAEAETVIHYTTDENKIEKKVLDEYKNLLNKNKKLIGWVKIDDTNIDYPVMQTSDNEYYLDHNLNQEYDKNGSIFMDKACDVLKPSTNLILYGHHMRSGQMFGNLDDYEKESYYEEHPLIQFDTIYEKGTYQIMYVFRSKVYSEEEIVFKYYQFIDVLGEKEFDSNMQEMAKMSLYDTGVTAQYGDRLLTLSTCDYREKRSFRCSCEENREGVNHHGKNSRKKAQKNEKNS